MLENEKHRLEDTLHKKLRLRQQNRRVRAYTELWKAEEATSAQSLLGRSSDDLVQAFRRRVRRKQYDL
jgi:hypothetical protein